MDSMEITMLPDGRMQVSAHFDDREELEQVAAAMVEENPDLIVSITPDE